MYALECDRKEMASTVIQGYQLTDQAGVESFINDRNLAAQVIRLTFECFPEIERERASESDNGNFSVEYMVREDRELQEFFEDWVGLHTLRETHFLLLREASSGRLVAMGGYALYHDSVFLFNLGVARAERQRGFAKLLLVHLEEVARLRRLPWVTGNVELRNSLNLSIYLNQGARIRYRIGDKLARLEYPVPPAPRPFPVLRSRFSVLASSFLVPVLLFTAVSLFLIYTPNLK